MRELASIGHIYVVSRLPDIWRNLRYAQQEQLGYDVGSGLDESNAMNENTVRVGESEH